jgi:hypothetical protein
LEDEDDDELTFHLFNNIEPPSKSFQIIADFTKCKQLLFFVGGKGKETFQQL